MIRGETVGTHIRELIWRCRARSLREVEGLSRPTSARSNAEFGYVQHNQLGISFPLNGFNMVHDPTIPSAEPLQQNFSFSPFNSLLVPHGPFSVTYNNASTPPFPLNSTEYYSPRGSTCPFTISTGGILADTIGMRRRRQGREFGNRDIRKGKEASYAVRGEEHKRHMF
jgi:hypothetical protein